jgi:hypothetical protein
MKQLSLKMAKESQTCKASFDFFQPLASLTVTLNLGPQLPASQLIILPTSRTLFF